jgi:hypothetical protein
MPNRRGDSVPTWSNSDKEKLIKVIAALDGKTVMGCSYRYRGDCAQPSNRYFIGMFTGNIYRPCINHEREMEWIAVEIKLE